MQSVAEFNKLSQYLRGFAFKLTRNREESQDLYQDTALLVYRNKDKFQAGTNLKAWVSTIMRNVFINKFRKKQRGLDITDNGGENFLFESNQRASANNDGEGSILNYELMDIIDSIEEGLKVPFWMYYNGFKYSEISEELDMPIGTVKSRIFFARKALRSKVKERFQVENYTELI